MVRLLGYATLLSALILLFSCKDKDIEEDLNYNVNDEAFVLTEDIININDILIDHYIVFDGEDTISVAVRADLDLSKKYYTNNLLAEPTSHFVLYLYVNGENKSYTFEGKDLMFYPLYPPLKGKELTVQLKVLRRWDHHAVYTSNIVKKKLF
jgi:hypothetical protein